MSDKELGQIKEKLLSFEKRIQELIASTQEDLMIAEQLQKILTPNRVPEIPGLKCIARYIPAFQISSEGFDVLPTKDGRQLWIVTSMAGNFGLSSLLLQTLVHLQSRAFVEAKPKVSVEELFNDLSTSLSEAKKAAPYRLFVARLDLTSLQMSGVAIGSLPLLVRRKDKNHYSDWSWAQDQSLRLKPENLAPAFSAAPTLARDAYAFSMQLEPGMRAVILSSEWKSNAKSLDDFSKTLDLGNTVAENDLLKDLNILLMRAEDSLKKEKRECDISALAIEIDAKKLHLA